MRLYFKYLIVIVLLFGGISSLIAHRKDVQSYEATRLNYISSEAKLLDRNGEVLHEMRLNSTVRRLDWTELNNIPETFQAMVIRTEDQRFYSHHGVDFTSLGGALIQGRGASTITMQLAGMLDPMLKPRGRRSLRTKISQMLRAWMIEMKWSKSQILESYFNLSFYRGELQGIKSASLAIFQKFPAGLSLEEAALLTALIQQPNGGESKVAKRACNIAQRLDASVKCDSIELLAFNLNIKSYSIEKRDSLAPHIARDLLKIAGSEIQSTLEKNIQQFSIDAVREQLSSLKDKNVNDAAVLVLHNQSGHVISYVGNVGSASTFYVDGVKALRQAGSTLKPFLYATAFEKKILTPTSILDDSPLEISVSGGMYKPRNYDQRFHGKVSVAVALGSSMNVPAVKTLQLVGVDHFLERLKLSGFTTLKESDYYGPSLALGSADISLWELTNAYRILANGGKYSSVVLLPGQNPSVEQQVFTEEAVYQTGKILSDANNRSLAFGLGSPLSGKSWVAVKTGTSKDMRDNWCIGYSDTYTVGVWVGNFSGEPMWNVSGVTGAAPIFSDIMNFLHQSNPSLSPKSPNNNETVSTPAVMADVQIPEIVYPTNQTIVAWDPDISFEFQKIIFEAKSYNKNWSWRLNEKSLGRAKGPIHWTPSHNGEYVLALVDQNKRILDQVQFEIRGLSTQKH